MAITPQASRIDLLPAELVSIIIDNIGHDLIAHVGFLKINEFVAGCYVGRDKKFWEPILRASGLGCLEDEMLTDKAWGELAVECVEHVESCDHPACGWGRLEENRKTMMESVNENDWDVMDVSSSENGWLGEQGYPIQIWAYIAFKSVTDYTESDDRRDSVCLRPISDCDDDMPLTEDLELNKHPIALRSFATSIPIPRIYLAWIPDLDVENERGIVVGDITNAIKHKFKDVLSNYDIGQLFNNFEDPRSAFPEGWTPQDTFYALSTVRDWFRLVHWQSLQYESIEHDGISIEWYSPAVNLPESIYDIRYDYAAPVKPEEEWYGRA